MKDLRGGELVQLANSLVDDMSLRTKVWRSLVCTLGPLLCTVVVCKEDGEEEKNTNFFLFRY